MLENINIINLKSVVEAVEGLACDEIKFAEVQSKDFELKQSETKPLKGFKPPKDFPFCCENHRQLHQIGVETFAKFPDCCEAHKKLKTASWFKKSDYAYLPDKLVKTITYTFHCIGKCIKKPNWYKEITDYIEYTVISYGQFPDGYGSPLGVNLYLYNLEKNLESIKEIPEKKKCLLIDYIRNYGKEKAPVNSIDLNILYNTYDQWLELFPFELGSYFGELEQHFEKQMPILKTVSEKNIYSGFAKAELHTKESLFDVLINLTNHLLTEINGATLLEKGLISDIEKIQVEIIAQERKQKLKQGYKNSSLDESHRFRKMIEDWLKDERIFLKKLEPLLNKSMLQKGVTSDMSFLSIDEELFICRKVPFEIELIYKMNYNQAGGQRFIECKSKEYHFFTPYDMYLFFQRNWKDGKLFTSYLEPLSFENVQPYYKAFGDGFLKGYNEFDEKVKANTAIFLSDREAIVKQVFQYINTPISGFSVYGGAWLDEKPVNTIEKDLWFESGVKTGENYKAWFFVLNNPSYFTELFRTHKPYINLYKSAANYWKDQQGGQGMFSHIVRLLNEIGEPVSEGSNGSKTKQFIINELENLDKMKGWEYAFENKNDFNLFVDLLTNYFEYKPYNLPQKKIRLKRGCKTRLAKALQPIHNQLCNENISRKSDVEFFEIVRVLNHFENMTDAGIYDAINR